MRAVPSTLHLHLMCAATATFHLHAMRAVPPLRHRHRHHQRPAIVQLKKPGVVGFVAGYALSAAAHAANAVGYSLPFVPKFLEPDSFHVVVAGGPAGKFSMFLPCFGALKPPHPFANLSRAVHRKVVPPAPGTMQSGTPKQAAAAGGGAKVVLLDPTHELQVARKSIYGPLSNRESAREH